MSVVRQALYPTANRRTRSTVLLPIASTCLSFRGACLGGRRIAGWSSTPRSDQEWASGNAHVGYGGEKGLPGTGGRGIRREAPRRSADRNARVAARGLAGHLECLPDELADRMMAYMEAA